jgi:DNA polymerase V
MPTDTQPTRRGPGRPPGEPTVRLRVPESQLPAVVAYLDAYRQPATAHDPRPINLDSPAAGLVAFTSRVRAGFPSPADDYIEDVLDLNRHLIRQGHEEATFVLRIEGWSMLGAGIHDGDEIIVDRAVAPAEGRIVVAVVNGDLTVKRLKFAEGQPVLVAENPHFKDITFRDGEELVIWGVVTRVLHRV